MTLEDLVRNYLDPVNVPNKENEVYVACPFCGDDQKRMGINVASGLAHCFRASCEWKTVDRRYLFRELSKVLNLTEKMDDVRFRKVKKVTERVSHARCHLPEEFEKFGDLEDKIEYQAWRYLIDRGMTQEQIKHHKLGFCAFGEYAWRIIIPVFRKDKLVAFTGRDFSGSQEPKYKNSKGVKYLYNVPRNKKSACVLVEGPMDVFAVERAINSPQHKDERLGYNVIGRLGAGLVKSALDDLLSYDEIIIWPDPDKGGIKMCIGTATSLVKRNRKVRIVMPLEDGDIDPGKLGETKAGCAEICDRIQGASLWTERVYMKLRYFAAFETPPTHKKHAIL